MNQNSDTDTLSASTLVTGATGDVGGQVLRRLLGDGVRVRAMCRREDQRDGLAALGAEPVLARFGDVPSLRAALDGCDRLFLLTPPVPEQAAFDMNLVDLAVEQGVRRVVRVSANDSNLRAPVPWARAHAIADRHLARSGLDWTVLRPSGFMQNFTQQAATIRRGFLPQTSGAGQGSWIDTADVAAVAARVLQEPGHTGATYFLTGPEPLSMPEVAARFAGRLGHRVRYVHLPGLIFSVALRMSGQSWFTARGLRRQFVDVVRANLDTDTTHEVERLTGRPATTIDEWITRTIDTFR